MIGSATANGRVSITGLGAYALAPLSALLRMSVALARFFAGLPGATAEIRWFTPALAAIAYVLLAVAALGRLPRPRHPGNAARDEPVACCGVAPSSPRHP